jgi:hypothetical protein
MSSLPLTCEQYSALMCFIQDLFNYCGSGLCPPSGIIKARQSPSGTPKDTASLKLIPLCLWSTDWVHLFVTDRKGQKTTASPEDGSRSSFRNGRQTDPQNLAIPIRRCLKAVALFKMTMLTCAGFTLRDFPSMLNLGPFYEYSSLGSVPRLQFLTAIVARVILNSVQPPDSKSAYSSSTLCKCPIISLCQISLRHRSVLHRVPVYCPYQQPFGL